MGHFGDGMDVLDRAGEGDCPNPAAAALDGRTILTAARKNAALTLDVVRGGDGFDLLDQANVANH